MPTSGNKVKIAPSILAADLACLGAELKKVEVAGADAIHIDVMDGFFVPNLAFGPDIVRMSRKITKLPLDVHLMIQTPRRYIADFAKAGADMITIHAEASNNLKSDIQLILRNHVHPGLAINPDTPIEPVLSVLDEDLAMIVIMSVHPGFAGQSFISGVLKKVRALKAELKRRNKRALIEIDGGVKLDNAKACIGAGADILVAGSTIFYSHDYNLTIAKLRVPN